MATRLLHFVTCSLLMVGCALDSDAADPDETHSIAHGPGSSTPDEEDPNAPGSDEVDPDDPSPGEADPDDPAPDDKGEGGKDVVVTPKECGGPAAGNTHFRAVHFNVLGSTFGSNWSARRSVVLKRMKYVLSNDTAAKASIYGLTEVTKSEATWLAQNLGSNFAVAVHNRLQAIVVDTTAWAVQDTGKYSFTSGSTGYHGFVHARLKNKDTGAQVNVVEAHLSPNAVADAATKRAKQLSQIKNTVGSWKNPALVLGDMNWNGASFDSAAGTGYCSVRKWAGAYAPSGARSYRTFGGTVSNAYGSGGRIIDHGLIRGGVTMRDYRVLRGNFDNKKAGSDHHMLTFQLTI